MKVSEAKEIGEKIGIVWNEVKFKPYDLAQGIEVEEEHGTKDLSTNITDDSLITTAKIAWAHLKERPDYYYQLKRMEKLSIHNYSESEVNEAKKLKE